MLVSPTSECTLRVGKREVVKLVFGQCRFSPAQRYWRTLNPSSPQEWKNHRKVRDHPRDYDSDSSP